MNAMLKSLLIVLVVAVAVTGATVAYFSDVETSQGNYFTAGTLDLSVDTENPLTSTKFTITNLAPGDTQSVTYVLKNEGSIDGFLDMENIAVTSQENGCNEPETAAGDTSCGKPGNGEGELSARVTMTLYMDDDCDGSKQSGEATIYSGAMKDVAASYDINRALSSGSTQCVGADFVWTSSAQDNVAQGDTATLAVTFELAQTSAQ